MKDDKTCVAVIIDGYKDGGGGAEVEVRVLDGNGRPRSTPPDEAVEILMIGIFVILSQIVPDMSHEKWMSLVKGLSEKVGGGHAIDDIAEDDRFNGDDEDKDADGNDGIPKDLHLFYPFKGNKDIN